MGCIDARTGLFVAMLLAPPAAAQDGGAPATAIAEARSDQRRERSARPAAAASVGLASFMATSLDGRKTASGERFDSDEMVAAHRTYPLGTRLRVTNLTNDRTVVVRVVDRMGPRRGPRSPVIDLSRAAAERLGFIEAGKTRVKMEIVERD